MAYDYKQDFPLLRAMDVAYVDNAATAQRPQCVLDAENDFYCRHNANPLRGLYPLSVEATDAYENAREAVRDFLGAASTQEIIFTRNTTESLNLVAYSYGLSHIGPDRGGGDDRDLFLRARLGGWGRGIRGAGGGSKQKTTGREEGGGCAK